MYDVIFHGAPALSHADKSDAAMLFRKSLEDSVGGEQAVVDGYAEASASFQKAFSEAQQRALGAWGNPENARFEITIAGA